MNVLYFLGGLIGLLIALVIDYVIAKQFSDIAEMKGHDGNIYFWYTFIFGFIGMLMVIALPTLKPAAEKPQTATPSVVRPTANVTPAWRKDKPTNPATHRWLCDNCGRLRSQQPCEYCGK